MELRRMNLFLFSNVSERIKFLSELEFEHGTEEIALETAMLDFTFHPSFVFRGGIILAPIGGFNQNHDSPRWDFIERPLVATEIIPSTLSEVGFGFNGKFYRKNWGFTYDAYLVNGLGANVIFNEDGRTSLKHGKHEGLFAEDNNGVPSFTGKIAAKHLKYGEVGLSYYGGVYNSYKVDGEQVEEKRNLAIYALDFSSSAVKNLTINGEFAFSTIDLPDDLSEFFGDKQWGGYVEGVYSIYKGNVFGYESSVVNLNLRLEQVDFNVGTFSETGASRGDQIKAIATGISWRPGTSTVLKLNYRYHWQKDVLNNPVQRSAGIQFGIATYF